MEKWKPRCQYTNVVGFDARVFTEGERVCIKVDGKDTPGTFLSIRDVHEYSPGDAMDPDLVEEKYTVKVAGETREYEPSEVGKLLNKIKNEPTYVKKILRENVPEDVERIIMKFGGKKSRRKPKRKARKTRRAVP